MSERRRRNTRLLLVLVLAWILTGKGIRATGSAVVYRHLAEEDPQVEGWGQSGSPSLVHEQGIVGYEVNDDSPSASTRFEATPDAALVQEATGSGWILATDLIVDDVPETLDYSVGVEYADGTRRFAMFFTKTADRGTRVLLWDGVGTSGQTATVPFRGQAHRYQLIFDASAGTAALEVNGQPTLSGYSGFPSALGARVVWGSNHSTGTGRGVYESVSWGPVSTPLALLQSGDQDPAAQGWSRLVVPGSAQPVPHGPLRAWRVNDPNTAAGSTLTYLGSPPPDDPAIHKGLGWTLRAVLSVADLPNTFDASVYAEHTVDNQRYALLFTVDDARNPQVRLWNGGTVGGILDGPSATVPGSGEHLYELVFDPAAGSADLFVDGVETISDYAGWSSSIGARLIWGSGHSAGTGEGWWSLVEFEVVTCSDGVIDANETCDDGNTVSGDGCDGTCEVEEGWSCTGAPSACDGICGDGLIRGAEDCDDGGVSPGDGCDAACQIEPGYICQGEPSSCDLCGDGQVMGTEACDDGNLEDGDGCDADCTNATGWSCMGEPSVCEVTCGDGMLVAGEACGTSDVLIGLAAGVMMHLELPADVAAGFPGSGIQDILRTADGLTAYVAVGSEIRRLDLNTGADEVVVPAASEVTALAFGETEAVLFFLEPAEGRVRRADLSGPTPALTTWMEFLAGPQGLAASGGVFEVAETVDGSTYCGSEGSFTACLPMLPPASGEIAMLHTPSGQSLVVHSGKVWTYEFLCDNACSSPDDNPRRVGTERTADIGAVDLAPGEGSEVWVATGSGGLHALDTATWELSSRSSTAAWLVSRPHCTGCDDGNLEDADGCSAHCEEEQFVDLCGVASGGSVDVVVDGVPLTVATAAGAGREQVAADLAAAINADGTLLAMDESAVASAGRLAVDGILWPTLSDPGLQICPVTPDWAPSLLEIVPDGVVSDRYRLTFESVAGMTSYHVYVGTLGSLYDHGSSPDTVCDVATSSPGAGLLQALVDTGPGDRYFLITGHDGIDEGPSGFDSTGLEIAPAESTCPP